MSSRPLSSSPTPERLTSHPLLDEEASPRVGRRTPRRERATESSPSSNSGYFSLKARLESDARGGAGGWDGSVGARGSKTMSRVPPSAHRALPTRWDAQSIPVLVVDSADPASASEADELYDGIVEAVPGGPSRDSVARMLSTPWHELSDSSLYSALDEQAQPHYAVIRTLSAATDRLLRARKELEESRRVLQEKEDARRARAGALLEEMPQSERDIARRVIASLFTRDDEEEHHVVRRQSRISLADTISEAMGEEVRSSTKEGSNDTVTPTTSRIQSAPAPLETIASMPTTPMPDDAIPPASPDLDESSNIETRSEALDPDLTIAVPETHIAVDLPSDASSTPSSPISVRSSRSRSQDARSVISARSDKSASGLGEWVGTLWGRRKGKEADTASEISASKDERPAGEPTRTQSAPAMPIASGDPSATDDTERKDGDKKDKDRMRRSVFGTFGLSLLAGSGARKKRPALEADLTPSSSGPPSAVEPACDPSPAPAEPEALIPPAAPALATDLPTAVSSPAESTAATPSEQAPQGVTIPALVAATRVMTTDPSSILIDVDVAPSIAEAAMALIKHVRDAGVDVRKPAKPRHSRRTSLAASLHQLQVPAREDSQEKEPSKRLSVAATMASVLPGSGFASPLLGSFLPQQRRIVGNAPTASTSGQAPTADLLHPPPPPIRSVALDAIIPAPSRPPTSYLSREYSALTVRDASGGDLRPTLIQHMSSFRPSLAQHMSSSRIARSGESGVLADRFGFTYDAATYDLLLLLRARAARCTAPACLTGVRIADRTEDPEAWDDDATPGETAIDVVQGACKCSGSLGQEADVMSISSGLSGKSKKEGKDGKDKDAKEGKRDMHAVLAVAPDTPKHVCSNVLGMLLNELGELHDAHQSGRRKEWDAFLAQRARAAVPAAASSFRASTGGTGGFLRGLDTSDAPADELAHSEGLIGVHTLSATARKELGRLARGGVPLALRAKIWLECTGALEMREPGMFEELLAASGDKSVEGEIEKDVGRTMPLNLFFGGDGAGVAKLRRVLVAYSRRNPAVGYCQGMNLLAATLLLVHAVEEDAFWVFTALIERVLPAGFFSPTLLPSRACPLVLLDVVHEHMPKLFNHLRDLGIDLPAICFSWFLSLFTDCLPVETLFRVWDVLVVDGFDVLFRLALSILRIGEPELLASPSIPAVYVALESLPTRMWEADRLLQMEADSRVGIVHADLVKRRGVHVQALEAALG